MLNRTVLPAFALWTGVALLLSGAAPARDAHPPEGSRLDRPGRPVGRGWMPLWNGKDLADFEHEAAYWKAEGGVVRPRRP